MPNIFESVKIMSFQCQELKEKLLLGYFIGKWSIYNNVLEKVLEAEIISKIQQDIGPFGLVALAWPKPAEKKAAQPSLLKTILFITIEMTQDQLGCLLVSRLWNEYIGGPVFHRKIEVSIIQTCKSINWART